ncbi:MAG: NAD(P)-dependent oxidoreductase, partial [Tateyamaria sp.]
MKTAGVIGLGDMGSGLAKNLIKNGFETSGFDLSETRMTAFTDMGGLAKDSVGQVGRHAASVFVMVMNGDQARDVILGEDGLIANMAKGGTVILSATITPAEASAIGQDMEGSDIHLIDTPVSGGFPGAQNGTLTMMAAGAADVLDRNAEVMQAVSATIHRVGENAGDGQTVKACLQSLIGSIFSATFEAAALAAKAGVSGQAFLHVFSFCIAACGVVNTVLEIISDRTFEPTGTHIATMHRYRTISLPLPRLLAFPMHTAPSVL